MQDQAKRFVIRYSGHVQGVGFRMTTLAQARGLAVNGFVRNEPDGSVIVDVEGAAAEVQELQRRISAVLGDKIDSVDTATEQPQGRTAGFRIEY